MNRAFTVFSLSTMHELRASYQKRFRLAFGIAVLLHGAGIVTLKGWNFFWPDEPMLAVRVVPYQGLDMMPFKEEEPEPPGAPPIPEPPAPAPPPPAPPQELTKNIIPVPDWEADSLMIELPLAPEHPVAEMAQADHTGAGESGAGLARGDGTGTGVAGDGEMLGPGDRKPRLIKRVEPVYPRIARMTGVEGLVVLSLLIDTSGHVREVKVVKSLGNTGCDEAAATAAMQWRFAPALRAGQPVSAWITAPILFRLDK